MSVATPSPDSTASLGSENLADTLANRSASSLAADAPQNHQRNMGMALENAVTRSFFNDYLLDPRPDFVLNLVATQRLFHVEKAKLTN
ncbi:hypothetical protein PABG_07520 [Paracoccidioides brasiliensis Pb03]|nr:hypothetical protein PABG_07520 [Paracoccidioides brasiliensis Pb03]